MKTPHGRCLCGKTRYAFDPQRAKNPLLCHCESCRRATASPVTGFFTVPDTAWRWVGAKPATYNSSPGVTRGFCASCGTPMFYHTDERPAETDFYAATLQDPTDFVPERNAYFEERLDWALAAADLHKGD